MSKTPASSEDDVPTNRSGCELAMCPLTVAMTLANSSGPSLQAQPAPWEYSVMRTSVTREKIALGHRLPYGALNVGVRA